MDKEKLNELYWLAEELKAYTDLTGERFDVEDAQNRLWKMKPTLSALNLEAVQQLYDELEGQLETPMFFDKSAFAEKVDAYYELLEKWKNEEF
jgi:hypothetical protein